MAMGASVHEVSVDEAKEQLADLIEEVSGGREVVIVKDQAPVVRLVRVHHPTGIPRAGSAKGRIIIHDNFDEPLEDFADYV